MSNAPEFVTNVVKNCLHVGKEDRVMVYTWRHTLDLAEAFVLECRKAGAKTLIELNTDRIYYSTVLNLPIEYLKQPDPFSIALLDVNTVGIFISGPEDPQKLRDIPPERMRAITHADKPYYEKFLEKKIRSAEVAYGYVTAQRAATYGINYNAWKENMQAALNVDYESMRSMGRKFGDMLEQASEVHITSAQGTDLRLGLEHRIAHISDGMIDEEDMKRGDVFTPLPSGYVAVVPKATTAEGTVIFDVPEANAGLMIQGVAWKFKDGILVSFEGEKNLEVIKELWNGATGDKNRLAGLALGLNSKAKTGYLHNQIALGTVTLSIGDNREMGGTLESDFSTRFTISRPTISLDGRNIINDGKPVL